MMGHHVSMANEVGQWAKLDCQFPKMKSLKRIP